MLGQEEHQDAGGILGRRWNIRSRRIYSTQGFILGAILIVHISIQSITVNINMGTITLVAHHKGHYTHETNLQDHETYASGTNTQRIISILVISLIIFGPEYLEGYTARYKNKAYRISRAIRIIPVTTQYQK